MGRPSLSVQRGRRTDALDGLLGRVLDATAAAVEDALIVAGVDGRIELWNSGAEQLFGWSADEAVGQLAGDLIVPTDALDRSAAIRRALLDGEEWRGEFTCRRRDGSRVAVRVTNIAVRGDDGSISAIVSRCRDRRDELSAKCATAALDALAEVSPNAVMTVTGEVITSWNPAATRLLGWSADEVIGQNTTLITPPERSHEREQGAAHLRGGETVNGHATVRLARDGSQVPVLIDVVPVFDAVRQAWIGLVTMRDGRTRDEVVEAAVEAAVRAETRSRLLLASSAEGIAVIDGEGRLKAVSSSVERRTGVTADSPVDPVLTVHPDDRDALARTFRAVLEHPAEQPVALFRLNPSGGEARWREATFTNLLHDPVVAGIVVNVQDVHEREVAARALRESQSRWSAVANRSSDVAMFFEADGTIRWVSPAVHEVFGRDPADLVGTTGFDLVHPDDLEYVMTEFLTGLTYTGDHVTVEFRVVDSDGRVRWVEEVATNLLDDPDVGFIVANVRDVTERRSAHDELARLALVDDLTGLPNRNALLEIARTGLAARDAEHECGVVFFDIDDFCDVNDTLGHAVGDALLLAIAERVSPMLSSCCSLARFGDDQFAVFCRDVSDPQQIRGIVRLVQGAMEAPFHVDGHEVFVVLSAGVALSPPDDVDALLRRADTALYRAKRAGRGQTVYFERELAAESRNRLYHAGELRRGIERHEIRPHYQPVVDLATGKVVAVEALARWTHATEGVIPPDVFIPAAEATGLIGELGRQILDQACRDARRWLDQGRRLQVSVNASAVQLMDRSFPSQVAETLILSRVAADQLTFEITETAALRDMGVVLETLRRLGELGVEMSLDDFGTGYSSLSLLKRLPVAAIKIDRSFVSGLGQSSDDDRIVTGVINLGSALGYRIVAEGVETEDQASMLRDLGCGVAQGYLWSPAVPAGDLLGVIDRIEGESPPY